MLNLTDPVENVPLVGKSYAKKLDNLKIKTVGDLLYHFPFRYEDYSNNVKIKDLRFGQQSSVRGEVLTIKNIRTKNFKLLTKAEIADDTGKLDVVWFNQPYLTRNIKKGSYISLSGKLSTFSSLPAFVSPEYELLKVQPHKNNPDRPEYTRLDLAKIPDTIHTGRLVPIYPETRGITSKWLRSRINFLLAKLPIDDPSFEYLPEEIIEGNALERRGKALKSIHFPENKGDLGISRERFAFEEFFFLQLRGLKKRLEWKEKPVSMKINITQTQDKIQEFIQQLPFELTNAQKKATDELLKDLESEKPMNRLLEGDVGSGKTIVAATALYACFLSGANGIFMAPTDILADQHFQTLKKHLEPYGVKIALHTGSKHDKVSPCHVWVGTHALFFKEENYDDVGIVVIDEQHRFGVEQRAKLIEKSKQKTAPHVLTLTATPIPRSLALTLYGDLDLSVLDESPRGRKRVKTWVVPPRKRQPAYEWIKRKILKESAQAFIICPLIEESEHETMKTVKAAKAEYENLKNDIFPDLSLSLLHGKLKGKEKDQVIKEFRDKKHHILVSTQVVEVGMDIPSATIMLIEAADRFGLASLHQLRGRVGRGEKQSYCLLFSESHSAKAYSRLKALEQTNSGFKLAELDLKLRGPGEVYGTKQHGILELKVADLADTEMIKKTKLWAQKLLNSDPTLEKHPSLAKRLEEVSSKLVEPN